MTPTYDESPAWHAPAGACDAHLHVFGPAERYGYGDELRCAPPRAPLADYLAFADRLGFERFVFVQPSAYGRDNTCMLDAMRELQALRGDVCRGIVDIDENAPEAELDRLHALGVRGVRINVRPSRAFEPGFGATLLPRLRTLEARCAERGWQLDFLMPGWLTQQLLPVLERLQVDFTLAHMGLFLAKDGVEHPGFRALLRYLREGTGHCWVKLTGVYRVSAAAGFADAAPMAQALIEAAPDRLIWGSDYPHLSFAGRVGSVELFNRLGAWADSDMIRRQILVDNPQRLYGL